MKYKYHERTFPEEKLGRRDIVWWQKGYCEGEYHYKAESFDGCFICVGETADEACKDVQESLPDSWFGFILFWFFAWDLKA
jgi:hypothetical protein